eukprot:scaffold85468_cov45-Phaeocystis_antarctica.AAC.1
MALDTPPPPDTAAATLGVIGSLCSATVTVRNSTGERRLSEAGSGSGEGGSGSGEAPRSKESLQLEALRAGISALGDATLKGNPDPNPDPNPNPNLNPNPNPNPNPSRSPRPNPIPNPDPSPNPNQAGLMARRRSP